MQTSQTKTQSVSRNLSTPECPLLEVNREFDVPVERLFQAFTNAESIKAFWWPGELYSDRTDLDFKNGGRYFINMKGGPQGGSGMTGKFEEIVPNERIVMTDNFANEKGEPISAKEAKMEGNWPEVGYITLTFKNTGSNKSALHLSQQGIPKEAHDDCVKGWSQMFDKLEKYLSGSKQ